MQIVAMKAKSPGLIAVAVLLLVTVLIQMLPVTHPQPTLAKQAVVRPDFTVLRAEGYAVLDALWEAHASKSRKVKD